jgi:hypothetical protein
MESMHCLLRNKTVKDVFPSFFGDLPPRLLKRMEVLLCWVLMEKYPMQTTKDNLVMVKEEVVEMVVEVKIWEEERNAIVILLFTMKKAEVMMVDIMCNIIVLTVVVMKEIIVIVTTFRLPDVPWRDIVKVTIGVVMVVIKGTNP